MGPSTRATTHWPSFTRRVQNIRRRPTRAALDAGDGRGPEQARKRHAEVNRPAKALQGTDKATVRQRIASAEAAGKPALADALRTLL